MLSLTPAGGLSCTDEGDIHSEWTTEIAAATLTPVTHAFGEGVTADIVEDLLHELPVDGTPRAVTLDLSTCRHISPGAGWRLGSAMSAWAADGELTVLVPDPGNFSDQWFLNFTRSGLGLALACHADRIETSEGDIRERVCKYYTERGNIGNENYAIEVDLVQTPLAVSIDAFDREIRTLASFVRLDFKSLDPLSQQGLREACFEAIENVGDHAFRAPWPEKATALSYFSLRYHKRMDSVNVPGAALHEYFGRLPGRMPEDRDQLGFIELVVTDNGNGIARRQSLDHDICDGTIEDEDAALHAAFEVKGSVKLRAGDSFVRGEPGYGFSYIARGLQRLNAYAILRTGRRLAVLDGSLPGKSGWAIACDRLAEIPGTTLQMYFPLISPQLHLHLSDDS